MERKVIVLLIALSKFTQEKFVILEKSEILDSIMSDVVNETELDNVMEFIEKSKLISVKYKFDEEYCLAFTEKGLVTVADIEKKIEEKQIAAKMQEELKAAEAAEALAVAATARTYIWSSNKDAAKPTRKRLKRNNPCNIEEAADESKDNIEQIAASDYLPSSLNELVEQKVIVQTKIEVIKETYSKAKVFFIGLLGGFLGSGLVATTYILVELYLI